jgi:hypothetical protein
VSTQLVQVEALQADTRRVARTNLVIDTLARRGFGMSDILLGTPPSSRSNDIASSWRDVATTPVAGSFGTTKVGMVWEVYDVTSKDGRSRYSIDVAVERVQKGVRGFAARVVDDVGRTVGREQRGTNRIDIRFDREVAALPRIVDFLTLDMRDAGKGEYRLHVIITDRETGAKTTRDSRFVLR